MYVYNADGFVLKLFLRKCLDQAYLNHSVFHFYVLIANVFMESNYHHPALGWQYLHIWSPMREWKAFDSPNHALSVGVMNHVKVNQSFLLSQSYRWVCQIWFDLTCFYRLHKKCCISKSWIVLNKRAYKDFQTGMFTVSGQPIVWSLLSRTIVLVTSQGNRSLVFTPFVTDLSNS